MHIFYQFYQFFMNLGAKFIKIPTPEVIIGQGKINQVGNILSSHKKKKVFICTADFFINNNSLNILFDELKKLDIDYVIYTHVDSNPTIENIEEGVKIYLENNCDSIVCIGGGSIIDASKIIGAKITNNKEISKMKGLFKIHHSLPLLIALPTTCGTGSETTIAAVIRDKKTNEKYAINDPHLVPKYAILDASLLLSLPKNICAYTSMDALTHALEAYLNKYNNKKTYDFEFKAIKLIFDNILLANQNPNDIQVKNNLLHASFLAGLAFTRKYVGYVHAIAHAIGGFYNTQHGYTNAILLPLVLQSYGASIYKKMGRLYDYLYGKNKLSNQTKCLYLIEKINSLNKELEIISSFKDIILEKDIPQIVQRSYQEANPLYPVSKILSKKEFENIIRRTLK